MKLLRLFIFTALLLIGALPTLAQESTPELSARPRHPLQILGTTAAVTDSGLTLTVQGAVTGGCGDALVEIVEQTADLVVIDVYTETAENVRCSDDVPDATVEIPLETSIPDMGLAVDINGAPYLINPDGSFAAAFVAPLGITDLSAAVEGDALVISIKGETDGCEVPMVVRQTVENGAVTLRVYRIMNAAMMCPMIAVEYSTTVEVPLTGDEGGVWVISANDREIGYDFDRDTALADDELTRIDATINSVTVNTRDSLPQQVTITIAGTHPDGCSVPTQVRQVFDTPTNTLNVYVYRVLPLDVMCASMIQDFTVTVPVDPALSGTTGYTINVNGTTVEA